VNDRSSPRDAIRLALLLALLTAVALARPLLPVDETRYAGVAWEMWVRGDFLVPFRNGEAYHHKPPLLFWLIHAGWALVGVNDWWPRLISPLFAGGTLLLGVRLARRLWPQQPAVAAITPYVLLASLLFAYFATALMFDAMLAFFVALGLLGLVEQPVDLVVSGINPYANLSHDVTYSGTVTAAMEAAIEEVPAIAFSLDGSETPLEVADYQVAAAIVARVVEQVIRRGLPAGVLFNVNIPRLPLEQIRGFRITRGGLRIYRDELVRREDPRGRPYYWIGGDLPTGIQEEGTDIGALAEGYVSITPLQLDLTAHLLIPTLEKWQW